MYQCLLLHHGVGILGVKRSRPSCTMVSSSIEPSKLRLATQPRRKNHRANNSDASDLSMTIVPSLIAWFGSPRSIALRHCQTLGLLRPLRPIRLSVMLCHRSMPGVFCTTVTPSSFTIVFSSISLLEPNPKHSS